MVVRLTRIAGTRRELRNVWTKVSRWYSSAIRFSNRSTVYLYTHLTNWVC